jgi:hypothetical protein
MSTGTFLTNDEWARRKGYIQYNANTSDGYLDDNETPNANTLNALRTDAHAIMVHRIGSSTVTNSALMKSLEYRIVEILRVFDVAIKRGDFDKVLGAIQQLLNILPSVQSEDLSLDAEDSIRNRGVTSG